MDDRNVDPNVLSWNCRVLKVKIKLFLIIWFLFVSYFVTIRSSSCCFFDHQMFHLCHTLSVNQIQYWQIQKSYIISDSFNFNSYILKSISFFPLTSQINQFKRHLDAGAVNEFWSYLDDFMLLKTPALYQGVVAGNVPPARPVKAWEGCRPLTA